LAGRRRNRELAALSWAPIGRFHLVLTSWA
jgi:hypothetical protein